MSKFKGLFEAQSGGYPLEQVLMIETKSEHGDTEPAVVAFFADAEMDVYCVEFGVDGEIKFDTSDFSYLSVYPEQLTKMVSLSKEAAALRSELSEYFDADSGDWKNHEHLYYKIK